MHWGSGLLILFCVLCFVPLRLQFTLEHGQAWRGSMTLQCLWFHPTKSFFSEAENKQAKNAQKLEDELKDILQERLNGHQSVILERQQREHETINLMDDTASEKNSQLIVDKHKRNLQTRWREWVRRTSFQAQWKAIFIFLLQSVKIVARWLHLEQLSLRCRVGWSKPSWTAYSYGLFWTAISFLPSRWLEQSTFTYLPDFQQERQEIALHGIIGCRIGQLILILISLLWLVIKAVWEQNRKEQIAYEG